MRNPFSYRFGLPSPFYDNEVGFFTPFSPADLFSSGSQGIWLDPSDVANLAWRRNLLTYSEQFDNAAWAKFNATVPSTQYLAPDGTTTADALFETTATGFHSVTAASTVVAATAGQSYTFSFYLKANGRTKGFMSVVTGVDFTTFDLTAKTNVFGGNGTSVTVIAQTITELPNGWFRLTSTVSISGNVNIRPVVGINNDSNASSYAGDASKGFYLWGAQLELGTSATDYQRISDVNTEVLERFPTATMFSDRAGTTPVTTPGTVVGLRLDKSKGLTLGAELVTNGGPFTATTGWTGANSAFVTISGSKLRVSGNGATGFPFAYTAVSTIVGRRYVVSAVASFVSGSNDNVYLEKDDTTTGSSNNSGSGTGPARTITFSFTATAATSYIRLASVNNNDVNDWDNISVRELAGNHAVAPTDAARPIYGVEPKGGRRNLLLATDTLATQSLTVTAVAHTLAFTGTGTVTLSGASTAGPLVGTGAGNRVSLTFTPTAASLTLTVSGSVTLGQLELGSSATAYQTVVTAYNVTESGVATCHYVQYDGSDDSMSTAAIDFTATDKMSVFAGVRKLSDAATGALIEFGSGADNGGFLVHAPNTLFALQYRWSFQNNAGTGTNLGPSTGYAAPINNVVTGIADISGDRSTLRVNGTQVAQSTSDQGTGNFGNYPLFIGRRNNATLPFNGRDYGIIVVGKLASAGEITDTELWLSDKTAEVDVAKSISPNIYTRSGDTILDRANSIIERRTV